MTKLARGSDPETSKAAGRAVTPRLGELQRYAVALVTQYPGKTASELAALDPRSVKDTRTIGRRLGEVEAKGVVRRGAPRGCTTSGRQAATWWPIQKINTRRTTLGGNRRR